MAISLVGIGTFAATTSKVASLSIPTINETINDDDILIITYYSDVGDNSCVPTDFTRGDTYTNSAVRIYWKRAASESGDYALSRGGELTFYAAGNLSVWRGCVLTGSPINAAGTSHYAENTNILRATGFTTTVDNTVVIACGRMGATDGTYTFTPVSGQTDMGEIWEQGYWEEFVSAYKYQTIAGSTGDIDWTFSYGAHTDKSACAVALTPGILLTTTIESDRDVLISWS